MFKRRPGNQKISSPRFFSPPSLSIFYSIPLGRLGGVRALRKLLRPNLVSKGPHFKFLRNVEIAHESPSIYTPMASRKPLCPLNCHTAALLCLTTTVGGIQQANQTVLLVVNLPSKTERGVYDGKSRQSLSPDDELSKGAGDHHLNGYNYPPINSIFFVYTSPPELTYSTRPSSRPRRKKTTRACASQQPALSLRPRRQRHKGGNISAVVVACGGRSKGCSVSALSSQRRPPRDLLSRLSSHEPHVSRG